MTENNILILSLSSLTMTFTIPCAAGILEFLQKFDDHGSLFDESGYACQPGSCARHIQIVHVHVKIGMTFLLSTILLEMNWCWLY